MEQPTIQEIQAQQGTRLDQRAPWETYSDELGTKLDPALAQEVAEYEQRRYSDSVSSSETKEELCRQRELNDEIAKDYQWIHPREYADEEARVGRVLTHKQFIQKLRDECKVECWYRDHPQPDKATLLYKEYGKADRQVACWVQIGYMPEYSFMRFDEHGVPLSEKRRGWRTCLLQLVLKGVLSESTATRVFGEAVGPASARYNSLMYEWRNRHIEVTEEKQ